MTTDTPYRHTMGPHRQVECEKCKKVMRSDNIKRHLKTCDGSGRKRLPFAAPLELMRQIRTANPHMPPIGSRDSTKIFNFHGIGLNLGNLAQKTAFNRLQARTFRALMTPQLLTDKVDGVVRVSEDDYAHDFLERYLPTHEDFGHFFYYHMICMRDDFAAVKANFDVLDPTCLCNCNRFKYVMCGQDKMVREDGTSPVSWEDVEYLFTDKSKCHNHFILKASNKIPPDEIQQTVRSVCRDRKQCLLMRPAPSQCWTRTDVARVLLYIQRSENTKEFCTHFDHTGTDFPVGGWRVSTRKTKNTPPNGVCATIERIKSQDRDRWTYGIGPEAVVQTAKLNCKLCRKVKRTPLCNQHMFLYQEYIQS